MSPDCNRNSIPSLTISFIFSNFTMATILHIDASPRGERSFSRNLTKEFVSAWQQAHPNDKVDYFDLGHTVVPTVDEAWIAAAFSHGDRTPEMQQALQLSDELIDRFMAADYYVLGVPMYNFNVPANFKAYLDQILRVNRTFTASATGYEGLVTGRKMAIVTARGGTFPTNTPMAAFDHQEPFLRTAFGLMGITDLTFIHADNLGAGAEARSNSLAAASVAVQNTIATWA
jgi:FMN-dependent NADH-azoreductase